MNASSPIGVFDSGLGGISVLDTLVQIMPQENYIFFGDSKHNPYGTKTKEEITKRCIEICDYFIQQDVKAIVIACNTATSACVNLLRKRYSIPIIGMEPALKVACEVGNHQKIIVWATDFTLREKKFADLMKQFEADHEIVKVACPKLVRLVEENKLQDNEYVQDILSSYLPHQNFDSLVLGCTHFVFYKSILEKMVPSILLIDGNAGTVHHLKDILTQSHLLNHGKGSLIFQNSLENKISLSKELFEFLQNK